jgi:hypothetical protein
VVWRVVVIVIASAFVLLGALSQTLVRAWAIVNPVRVWMRCTHLMLAAILVAVADHCRYFGDVDASVV